MLPFHKVQLNPDGTPVACSPSELEPSQKTGNMKKEGGLFKTWKQRFFVLSGNGLYYYETSSSSSPKGVLKLKANSTVSTDVDKVLSRRENSSQSVVVNLVGSLLSSLSQS